MVQGLSLGCASLPVLEPRGQDCTNRVERASPMDWKSMLQWQEGFFLPLTSPGWLIMVLGSEKEAGIQNYTRTNKGNVTGH